MIETTGSSAAVANCATQHGMLVIWGHFARTIGLLERLGGVLVPQKTVLRPPQEKRDLPESGLGLHGRRGAPRLSIGPDLLADAFVWSAVAECTASPRQHGVVGVPSGLGS